MIDNADRIANASRWRKFKRRLFGIRRIRFGHNDNDVMTMPHLIDVDAMGMTPSAPLKYSEEAKYMKRSLMVEAEDDGDSHRIARI